MAVPTQFAYRTLKGIGITNAAPVYESLPGFHAPEGTSRCCTYSPCGTYFAWATNEGVTVVEADNGTNVLYLPIPSVYELGFSPQGSYLITWERFSKDENGDAVKNLKVWRTIEQVIPGVDKEVVGKFVQRSQSNWNLQYTPDEKYCARTVTNEVQFYESDNLGTVWNKLRAEGVTDFSLSPGQTNSIAIFIPERKGQPAAVKVYNVPQFNSAISQKTFYKGDKVDMKWNKLGTTVVVLAQTESDKTGKSYYGESTLYVLSANGSVDARLTLDKEGPIHDVTWSPNSKEFGVVYGFMPAKATIFNARGVATHSFGSAPKNTIIFSPTGRLVILAGFGNLAGQIDIYDLEKDYRKVTTIDGGNPSVCDWSSDGKYILTATTSPRLRVDNGVRIWHASGIVVYNEDMVELYHVTWRPQPLGVVQSGDPLLPVPIPHSSAIAYMGTRKTPSKPAGAYRPPGARGTSTPLHFKREDEGGAAHIASNGSQPSNGISGIQFGRNKRQVLGAETVEPAAAAAMIPGAAPAITEGDEILSKAALKNKKKREAKKLKDAEAKASGLNAPEHQGQQTPNRSPDRRNQPRSRSRGFEGVQTPKRQPAPAAPPGLTRQNLPTHTQQSESLTITSQEVPLVIEAPELSVTSPNGGSPYAKKLRGLQKKIRAIEDLEMRLAGGEKLEDTQLKKIGTKVSVQQELDQLEKETSF